MKKLIIAIILASAIVSCQSTKTVDVKSPCVSLEDGPCGPKKPVNNWWLNKTNA